jgi:hypothetical protein
LPDPVLARAKFTQIGLDLRVRGAELLEVRFLAGLETLQVLQEHAFRTRRLVRVGSCLAGIHCCSYARTFSSTARFSSRVAR